ncbi:MAG: flagellar hook-associated protein FlgK [bacterium]|nr:flagellar hook-associated protein FlgK [bacterium]
MPSLFMGIEIGARSIAAHQLALNTTSHNIANANNRDYSRQRVNLVTTNPFYYSSMQSPSVPAQIGTGVHVSSIERAFDDFVNDRLNQEDQKLGYWKSKEDKLHRMELIFNEPSNINIRSLFDQFMSSLQDLANQPEFRAARSTVKEKADALVGFIRNTYRQLQDLQYSINNEVKDRIEKINVLSIQIADLTGCIEAAEAKEENPNDLLDRRDKLINELCEIADVKVAKTDPDDFKVSLGGLVLTQGSNYFLLDTKPDPERYGMVEVIWKDSQESAIISSGGIKGLLEIRDENIIDHMAKLDELVITLVDKFNEIHRSGFGLDNSTNVNFFEPLRLQEKDEIFKISGKIDGYNGYVHSLVHTLNDTVNNPYLNDANYNPAPIASGAIVINGKKIVYDISKDSINDVVERINKANTGVVASINPAHRLTLTASVAKDYKIEELRDVDGGNLFRKLGIVDGTNVGYPPFSNVLGDVTRVPYKGAASVIDISSDVKKNLNVIATAKGIDNSSPLDGVADVSKGAGNNENVLGMVNLSKGYFLDGGKATFSDFMQSIISKVGVDSSEAKNIAENQRLYVENIELLKDSISGVSLDEEMINMIKYQHGYTAAARVISTMDTLIQTVINLGR